MATTDLIRHRGKGPKVIRETVHNWRRRARPSATNDADAVAPLDVLYDYRMAVSLGGAV